MQGTGSVTVEQLATFLKELLKYEVINAFETRQDIKKIKDEFQSTKNIKTSQESCHAW